MQHTENIQHSSGTAPAVLTIDRAALAANYRLFREMGGPGADVAGIVKADGYGLGMLPVAEVLYKEGCRLFFVATPDEAIALRAALPEVRIAVLGGLYKGAESAYSARRLIPVLGSLEELARWRAARGGPAILHFDTGMNRLGFGADETQILLADPSRLEGLDIYAVMSHFACADEAGHPLTAQQYDRFRAIAARFPQVRKSLANSAGIFADPRYHFDILRPGIALYGGSPSPTRPNPVRAVAGLKTRVLQVRAVKKGESIGYGASHVFERDTQTATVALGYADGILRSLSNRGNLYWHGQACPVRGRVSMDLITLETGHLPDPKPAAGDWLEVLGPHQDADALAAAAGTISYEILTGLGKRYARKYTG